MPDRNDKAQVIGQEDRGPDYVPNSMADNKTARVNSTDPATAAILQEQGKDPVKDQDELRPPTTVEKMYGGKVTMPDDAARENSKDGDEDDDAQDNGTPQKPAKEDTKNKKNAQGKEEIVGHANPK